MRRTARALSVAALVGVVLGFVASAAWADPAAEVSPGTVSPGGNITVSVSCDPLDGSAPGTIDATSQAFEEGTVQLKLVSGNDEKAAGPAYSGTARLPPAENFEGDPDAVGSDSAWTVDGTCPAASGGEGKPWSATLTVTRDSNGAGTGGGGGGKEGSGGATDAGVGAKDSSGGATDGSVGGKDATEGGKEGTEGDQGSGEQGTEGGKQGTEGGKQGTDGGKQGTEGGKDGADSGSRRPCTGSPADGTEPDRSEPYSEGTGASWGGGDSHSEDCRRADTQHGVQAGAGGTFTDSVPALVAGGVLITGALGGAAYRLRRKTSAAED